MSSVLIPIEATLVLVYQDMKDHFVIVYNYLEYNFKSNSYQILMNVRMESQSVERVNIATIQLELLSVFAILVSLNLHVQVYLLVEVVFSRYNYFCFHRY